MGQEFNFCGTPDMKQTLIQKDAFSSNGILS